MLMQLPGRQGHRQGAPGRLPIPTRFWVTSHSPRSSIPATPNVPWPAPISPCRPWRATRTSCRTLEDHNLDPDLFKDRSFEGAVNGKTVLITGASSRIGKAAAFKIAGQAENALLVARSADKLEDAKREIQDNGGTAYAYSADLSDPASIDQLVERVLADHPAVDILVNNAGRSIRRSVALSYDRFHDYERTIQLNYLGTI